MERLRMRSELEQIRASPLGSLIDPARTVRLVVVRYLGRLRRLLGGGRRRMRSQTARRAPDRPRRLPPRLSGSELTWLVASRLRRRGERWSSSIPPPPASGEWLTPILVDYFGRDGSTVLMALLATSPEIVIDEKYPYERRYFNYLWRWSRLLSRTDWPGALWSKDDVVTIAQEQAAALLGPPPWLPRDLLEPARGGAPISRRCFELAWRELSARASERVRGGPGGPAKPRYYAEKHGNTWMVDLRELPPLRLIVLLRDPRDTEASIRAFREREPATSFGIQNAWTGADRLPGDLERHRQRLRWIAGLLEGGQVPVIRYEDLSADIAGVADRLGRHLEVELRPEALGSDDLAARHGSSSADGSGRWQRDLDPEIAERFNRELGPELEAVGFSA
jgi:hypothetical protein